MKKGSIKRRQKVEGGEGWEGTAQLLSIISGERCGGVGVVMGQLLSIQESTSINNKDLAQHLLLEGLCGSMTEQR